MKSPISATGNEYESLVGHEDWVNILEPALCQDSAAVECLARLLFTIKKAIENGPGGVEQASKALLAGIESAYLYTDAHRAALKLYLLSLPLQLINGAIKRSAIENSPAKKKSASKRKRRS